MTALDDAHAALHRAYLSSAWEPRAELPREQAGAVLDEAARLVAERDAARRERDEARAVPVVAGAGGWAWTVIR